MMMWISKLAKAVCFMTGLTWKGGHDEAADGTMYLKDTLTTEEQQQLTTCLSKDKICPCSLRYIGSSSGLFFLYHGSCCPFWKGIAEGEAIDMSQDDRSIYLPERRRVEASSMTVT
ncbi:uncharacterized protein LOC106345218 [Brassica napus]|uniref:uncharacterized protein LOC106316571 n=1 Tax=Brassica oleracea var. oleracea TaxID=109376 RepID=UPI0006A6C7B7|nr:PREDICTED: uncharacterized protein LOC106316571 [Brassica oleracea var. oleracea]XP_013609915.1 PREDICTED: uncharacterized protein LOC106316571 [Brassica oleracea var. oleracea]XP_013639900.1 uncharacterized protein LOC106345218 [Brassica napus]XP_048624714.1 uncharacterized protein LOC106345218 [Brassica napus]